MGSQLQTYERVYTDSGEGEIWVSCEFMKTLHFSHTIYLPFWPVCLFIVLCDFVDKAKSASSHAGARPVRNKAITSSFRTKLLEQSYIREREIWVSRESRIHEDPL
jgi:hypothetical protein